MKSPLAGPWHLLALAASFVCASTASALQETPDLRALRLPLPPALPIPTHVVAGDLDGDGDVDAYAFSAEGVRLLRNDGRAWFDLELVPRAPIQPDSVALADLDGDGDLDLYFGSVGDRLYANDGTGQLTEVGGLPQVVSRTRAIVTADFDADGDVDVFAGGDEDALFENDGAGVFTRVPLPPQTGVTLAAAALDYDLDGDLDLLRAGDELERIENDANFPTIAAGTISGTGLVQDILGADLDGDGIEELVLGAQQPIWVNDGMGDFTPLGNEPTTNSQKGLALDIDGDGDLDLLLGNSILRAYRNEGGLTFTDFPIIGILPDTSTPADLDGDEDIDILLGTFTPILNDGSGQFGASSRVIATVLTGDLDGDGLTDVLGHRGNVVFAFGTGGAESRKMPWFPSAPLFALPFDADGDGDLDVFAQNDPGWRLWLNDGHGNFSGGQIFQSNPLIVQEWAHLRDANSDSILDLLVLDIFGEYQDEVYLGDGAGGFALAPGLLPAPTLSTSMSTFDVDGDGDNDLLFGGFQNPSRLFTWNGSGFDDASSNLPPEAEDLRFLVTEDWDADGDLDVYAVRGIQSEEPSLILTNDGTGSFTATPYPPASFCVAYDFDADGDLDIVHSKVWLQNDGSGQFTQLEYRDGPNLGRPRIGDFDGDGDDDLFDDDLGLFTNVERQLARASHARIGADLVFDVYDVPGSTWTLAYSLGPGRIELPLLGTLYLDPESLRIVDQGVLDGDGRASIVFPVPNDATLIGKTIFWQGLSGTPLRFTSHERTTLGAF